MANVAEKGSQEPMDIMKNEFTTEELNTNPDGSRCVSWIQDPITGVLIPRSRYQREDNRTHMIMKPLEEFTSPIDGRTISCRSQLRSHNEEHGVANIADYGDSYFKRKQKENSDKAQGRTKSARIERREALAQTMHDYGLK